MKRATANSYMSQYILLRDAAPPNYDYCRCCTCGRIIPRVGHSSHAGHFIGKGHGGSSGVYFDERNVHVQCHTCNTYEQGNGPAYYEFMLRKYGQAVIDELKLKHKLPRPHTIAEYGILYREKLKELKRKLGL